MLVSEWEWSILFITGQLPQDKDGNMLHIWDTEKQTQLVFSHIFEVLKEANMFPADIVKLTIYVKGSENIKIISTIRDEIFYNIKPASTLIEVCWFARDGSCVEIDAIAIK